MQPTNATKFHPGALSAAHRALTAAVAANPAPVVLGPAADRFDLMARRDHVDAVLQAALAYARTIVADTADVVAIGDLADETDGIEDAIADVRTAFDDAIDRLIDDQDEAA